MDNTLICLVTASIKTIDASPPTLIEAIKEAQEKALGNMQAEPSIKDAVRAMLKFGGYKPSGRQKPASEYLAQAAREGRFPLINGPVDCNNLLSLETGLPISLLDRSKLGTRAIIRICSENESYIFNASGQEMDLNGLICVCDYSGQAMGNPVKDSMLAKLKEDTKELAGFIYAPASMFTENDLKKTGERFAWLLKTYCKAEDAQVQAIV